VDIPAAASIGSGVFSYTGSQALTITLGNTPPNLGTYIFSGVNDDKTVTVKRPAGAAAAYGPYPPGTTTENWGDAFRGEGWDGTEYLDGTFNQKITLIIEDL
jgi:hypothetical protein